ncbi:hypothetical protein MPDQ_005459 [Monascus purpureus]|uniref:Uncharacterized protein n=1 Tax=Monascus purpureus TaxID=5098 RepID=A0A507QZX3_MONPU|nr:hypothetical protein MPDQ_005459 [Monascus purpureus]BDD57794.1 hypothetical protein MAP00_003130 [Monascus purpureus]
MSSSISCDLLRSQPVPSGEHASRGSQEQSPLNSPTRQAHGSESSAAHVTVNGLTASPNRALESTSDVVSRGATIHRRTGSTLKNVMRKIFSRRRRSQTDEFEDTAHGLLSPHNYRTPSMETGEERSLQFTVVNLTGSNPSSPLLEKNGSQEEPPESSKRLENGPVNIERVPLRPRRATLPSLVLLDKETQISPVASPGLDGDKEKLQTGQNSLQSKRRSRSEDTLRGLAKFHRMSPIQWRRHNGELGNDWKQSKLETTSTSGCSTTHSTTSEPANERKPSQSAVPGATPDQETNSSIVFNAGDLFNSIQNGDDATLEQRITTLEVKLIDLELAIARMQGHTIKNSPPDKTRPKQPVSPVPVRENKRHEPSESASSIDSFNNLPLQEKRPLSTSTIRPINIPPHLRGVPSISSLNEASPVSVEQYSALVMLLRRERSARRNLESQVAILQEDIRQMQGVTRSSMNVGTRYPIRSLHSEEFIRLRQVDSLPTGSPASTLEKAGFGPAYDNPSDSDLDSGRRDDGNAFGPYGWHQDRRIEVSGMI